MSQIRAIQAEAISDSRGKPTLEVKVETNDEQIASASVPSGASKGTFEAVAIEVNQAIENINNDIAPQLINKEITAQKEIDKMMIELDGTTNKEKLGANAILGVSLAIARTASQAQGMPLYQYIHSLYGGGEIGIPTPMLNLINGGKHAHNNIDYQEFMIVPTGFKTFKDKMSVGKKIFQKLRTVLEHRGLKTNTGDEGGYAPDLDTNEMAFGLLDEAIEQAGYKPGVNVFLALDVAASSLPPTFQLNVEHYLDIIKTFPIISLEDPLPEEDWDRWAQLKLEISQKHKKNYKVDLIGDDLFVTHPDRLQKGINDFVATAILVKLNQIGTLTETLDVIKLAKQNNYKHIISHRSGETFDTFIADLAVGTNADYIKAGAPNEEHRERTIKYQRLIEIEEELQGVQQST